MGRNGALVKADVAAEGGCDAADWVWICYRRAQGAEHGKEVGADLDETSVVSDRETRDDVRLGLAGQRLNGHGKVHPGQRRAGSDVNATVLPDGDIRQEANHSRRPDSEHVTAAAVGLYSGLKAPDARPALNHAAGTRGAPAYWHNATLAGDRALGVACARSTTGAVDALTCRGAAGRVIAS